MLPLRDRLPTRTIPVVNYLLIAANVIAFIWERALVAVGNPAELVVRHYGLVPFELVHAPGREAWTVFSSMFLHDPTGWAHIGGNMLFLWIFGDNVEDALGSLRYALFYLVSGIAAAMVQVVIDPGSHIPMVGASGAIAGVLAAYARLYPRSPILLLNPVIPLWFFLGITFELPAWLVILEFFVYNLWSGLGSLGSRAGGVAFFAHLGGFAAGLLLLPIFMMGRERRDHDRWAGWRPPRRRGPDNDRGVWVAPPRRRPGPWDW